MARTAFGIWIFSGAHKDPMPEKRATSYQRNQAEPQAQGSRQETAHPLAIAAVLEVSFVVT
ncbi:MAG TPA: hypothetical protein VGG62_14155 [Terracidiphilus sp.]